MDGSPVFKVLATCAVFEPGFRGGGALRSVAHIVDTISEHIDLALITRDRDLGSPDPYPGLSGRWVSRGHARVFYQNIGDAAQWWRLWRELRATTFDVLYVNSLWAPAYTVIPIFAARLGMIRARRVLVAPRGELSPGAMSLKARKKRLFLKWWRPFLKRMDVVWHASTDREALDISAVFPWARVEINQDQVSLPEAPIRATAANKGPARLVFIGRVSVKKNLELTLSALRSLLGQVEFDIYGPVEDTGYWTRCQSLISRLPTNVNVRYRGELAPADVCRTFARYDAFVFPTLGENFGHVLAESLSASCPVICSDQTPWTPVLEGGGGAVLRELTAGCLGRELERIAGMTPTERLRARQVAGAAYQAWRRSADNSNVLEQIRLTRADSRRQRGAAHR
jgi:glycosyltransferase involved in cell wall biosynthesis